jgi:hypothetical protein
MRFYTLFIIVFLFLQNVAQAQNKGLQIINPDIIKTYVDRFNASEEEPYKQAFPNSKAFDFLSENIPRFVCPDKNVERTYYFRWWTYRKHIKKTPNGFIITEFLPDVSWASTNNAIPCAGLHHFREGRWLHNPVYLHDYTNFWVYHSGYHQNPKWKHFKSVLGHGFPLSDAVWQLHNVHFSDELIKKILPELTTNYEELKKLRKTETGLYWSNAGGWEGDGMEVAVGGNGVRPTINSYMYAQAKALSEMYDMKGDKERSEQYKKEAEHIADLLTKTLWDNKDGFFKVLRHKDIPTRNLADVRELFGYVPWYFSIPPKNKEYEQAWKQVLDTDGFYAPYGLTTTEQRHSKFKIAYQGHECQWNGPSWPYATAQTLTAMANVIQDYPQNVISRSNYLELFLNYTNAHSLQKADGSTVPWIDENLNPYTGDWIARTLLQKKEKEFNERGKDYNHSTYVDLLITGLVGLKPRTDDTVEVNPVLPDNVWEYFCLDNVYYHGHYLTIIWDKSGTTFNRGKGLIVLCDGKEIARAETLSKLTGKLP